MIWGIAWQLEDREFDETCQNTFLYRIIERPFFLSWWIISDLIPARISDCEIMAKLVCNSSLLKDSDYRLKNLSFSHKICIECCLGIRGIREDTNHLVMQCPASEGIRSEMLDVLKGIDDLHVKRTLEDPQNLLNTLMGHHPVSMPFESALKIWDVSSRYISTMYRRVRCNRKLSQFVLVLLLVVSLSRHEFVSSGLKTFTSTPLSFLMCTHHL